MKYEAFEEIIFRCPSLPITNDEMPSTDEMYLEAIYLASPDLWDSIQRQSAKDKKVKISMLKYLNRMKSRCTPFGLFAGIGLGKISHSSNGIQLDDFSKNRNHIRLDMEFLSTLYDQLLQNSRHIKNIALTTNSSLYKIGDNYRYHEYYFKNGDRLHNLVEIEGNTDLDLVISACKLVTTAETLTTLLVGQGYDKEESEGFIDTLLDSQILIPEMSQRLTGLDLLEELYLKIQEYRIENKVGSFIKELAIDIKNVNSLPIGKRQPALMEIERKIKQSEIPYKRKYLFQSDTFIKPIEASIGIEILKSVSEGIKVLNALNVYAPSWPLEDFKERYYARYEEEEIPLAEALDPDVGIGFSRTVPGAIDFGPLIEGVIIDNANSKLNEKISKIELLLWKKYNESQKNGEKSIFIFDDDLEYDKITWDDLPETFAAIIEVINSNSDPLIFIKSVVGSSSAKTLGRFSYLDRGLSDFVEKIYETEQNSVGNGKILAEIIHLPEARTGNILFRNITRKYEIPYLGKSSLSNEYSIPVQDLMVSVPKGKKIKLRCKRLNKEIIPRLTTAHNYNLSPLPIYQFLCLLQDSEKRASLNFQWGSLLKTESFLPRVCYKNIILSPATWSFPKTALGRVGRSETVAKVVSDFKSKNMLPNQILLTNHDNKLLIDFNIPDSSEMFYNEVKDKSFVIEEFLFDPKNPLIYKNKDPYRNEIILSYYKK
ncbi:MAG: hypothetical protein DI535_16680 [Citrobacter freundii]|nr:MAG: hypothetical protein DI535_16680 [Citrobacter freundii]